MCAAMKEHVTRHNSVTDVLVIVFLQQWSSLTKRNKLQFIRQYLLEGSIHGWFLSSREI